MITHDQLGNDEDLAREVLVIAHDIAPCLTSLEPESEAEKNALAVIRRVYGDALARGSRMVKGQRIGSASIDYADIASAFEGQPTRALRAICSARKASGAPRGSFPTERPLQRLWPEHYA